MRHLVGVRLLERRPRRGALDVALGVGAGRQPFEPVDERRPDLVGGAITRGRGTSTSELFGIRPASTSSSRHVAGN